VLRYAANGMGDCGSSELMWTEWEYVGRRRSKCIPDKESLPAKLLNSEPGTNDMQLLHLREVDRYGNKINYTIYEVMADTHRVAEFYE
jgi:hypothetical protein